MALDLYRRHGAACKFADKGQNYTKCTCVIWCYGSVNGRPRRTTLHTRDWSIALRLIQEREADPENRSTHARTPADAVNEYLDECHARRLAKSTIASYENLLSAFTEFCERRMLRDMRGLRLEDFRAFRAQRKVAVSTQRKEIEHLRAWCRFCIEHEWMGKNHAAAIKPPKEAPTITMPYEREEITKLLDACGQIDNPNQESADRAKKRARALLLLMLYSGLRISDVLQVRRNQLSEDGRLRMRTMKTGVPIYVRLHPDCVSALLELSVESEYFLWSGNGQIQSATGSARRTVTCISKIAGVRARPHRFRDTFAVELLAQGEDIRTVQLLLGHESVKTTEKHYAPFVRRFQQRLDEATVKLQF